MHAEVGSNTKRNSKALVTIACGTAYQDNWKRYCEPNWRRYAAKHGFDVICLDAPLDTSLRARQRSISWQKCLILGHPAVKGYDQITWVDSDILINHHTAPDITAGVPRECVGAAEDIGFSKTEPLAAARFLERAFEYWPDAVINRTPGEFYSRYGLPDRCERVLNPGVMVLSPAQHRGLFEFVYHAYEEKGGREWLMEMRPLSYEILNRCCVHWIDPRFNLMWPYLEMMYYPFLLPGALPSRRRSLWGRLRNKFKLATRHAPYETTRRFCLNGAFHSAFFLHFGGMNTELMGRIDEGIASWKALFW